MAEGPDTHDHNVAINEEPSEREVNLSQQQFEEEIELAASQMAQKESNEARAGGDGEEEEEDEVSEEEGYESPKDPFAHLISKPQRPTQEELDEDFIPNQVFMTVYVLRCFHRDS